MLTNGTNRKLGKFMDIQSFLFESLRADCIVAQYKPVKRVKRVKKEKTVLLSRCEGMYNVYINGELSGYYYDSGSLYDLDGTVLGMFVYPCDVVDYLS